MSIEKRSRLSPKDLTVTLPAKWMKFKTTADLKRHDGMIGQDRAMRAVEVGLKIGTRGYNIFAVGEPGSGKTSTLVRMLKERAKNQQASQDVCYVYNFQSTDRPRPLMLPPGKGRDQTRRMLEELYALQAEMVEPDYRAATTYLRSRSRKRALVAAFTDLVDAEVSGQVLAYLAALAPQHLPMVVTIRDEGVEELAAQEPVSEVVRQMQLLL